MSLTHRVYSCRWCVVNAVLAAAGGGVNAVPALAASSIQEAARARAVARRAAASQVQIQQLRAMTTPVGAGSEAGSERRSSERKTVQRDRFSEYEQHGGSQRALNAVPEEEEPSKRRRRRGQDRE